MCGNVIREYDEARVVGTHTHLVLFTVWGSSNKHLARRFDNNNVQVRKCRYIIRKY